MKNSVELVTPDMAREMLQSNTENRRVRVAWVENLASQIERGEWMITHQGIAFDETGRLVDGQHRLMAIVMADRAVSVLVTRGLVEGSYKYIDGGRARLFSDRITLVNDRHDNEIINGLVRAYLESAKQQHARITVTAIEDAFLHFTSGFQAVAVRFRTKVRGITRKDVGAALSIFCDKFPVQGDEFVARLMAGDGLAKGSPILALREALLSGRLQHGTELYWKTIYACNKHLEGSSIMMLQAATKDFAGNVYARAAYARSVRGRKRRDDPPAAASVTA